MFLENLGFGTVLGMLYGFIVAAVFVGFEAGGYGYFFGMLAGTYLGIILGLVDGFALFLLTVF